METEVKETKAGLKPIAMLQASNQMPVDPPRYPGLPNSTPIFVAVDTGDAASTVPPVGTGWINAIGIEPVVIVCGVCNQRIVTRIERSAWFRTHCWAGVLCLFGCWPCVPIPYCTHVCKKAIHFCPNCDSYIATQL